MSCYNLLLFASYLALAIILFCLASFKTFRRSLGLLSYYGQPLFPNLCNLSQTALIAIFVHIYIVIFLAF